MLARWWKWAPLRFLNRCLLTTILLWSILIDALNAPLQQVNANKALLAKIDFPREAAVPSEIYQALFNAAIKLGILLLVLLFLGVHPGWLGQLNPLVCLSWPKQCGWW